MWNFKSSLAWGLLRQTATFTSYRLGVFLGIALCYALLAWIGHVVAVAIIRAAILGGAGFGTVIALARTMPPLFIVLFCGGFGVGMWFLRKHLYWHLRAPHMALMAEILEGRRPPEGGQIKAAMAIVRERYGDMNRLWALRGQIEATLPAINALLPLRALFRMKPEGKGVGMNQPYLRLAERPIDEMVLAHGLRKRAVNPYAAAREGLVLLAQNGKPVVGNALTLQGIGWAYSLLAFVGWLLVLTPFILLAPGAGLLVVIISGFFAWGTKAGLIDAFTNACLLQIYIGATRGQRPNPEWEARLDADAPTFVELGQEAAALPGGANRSSAGAQKTVIGDALPDPDAPDEPAPAASVAPAAAVAVTSVAATTASPEEQAGASAFTPPEGLMPSGFVPPIPTSAPVPPSAPSEPASQPTPPSVSEGPAPQPPVQATPPAEPPAQPAPATTSAPTNGPTSAPESTSTPPDEPAQPPAPEPAPTPEPTPVPDPAPAPPPPGPPNPPANPPRELPPAPPPEAPEPTPPEVPDSPPPQEVPPSAPPELPTVSDTETELPPLTGADTVTTTPQVLADAPGTQATPAAIPDPWSTPAQPEPEPAPTPEPKAEPAPAPVVPPGSNPFAAAAPASPPRDEVTKAPQPLAEDPQARATPAEIADPWAPASAAAPGAPPPPPPAPEELAPAPPPPEPAAPPAPTSPAASAKTVIAPMPIIDDEKKPDDEA